MSISDLGPGAIILLPAIAAILALGLVLIVEAASKIGK
jgi:hypothetical protein